MTHPLRMRFLTPIVAAIAGAVFSVPAATGEAPEAGPGPAAGEIVPNQVIVRYEAGSSAAERADAREEAGARAIEGLGMARAQLLEITDGGSVAATVRQLEAQPEVAYAEPNGISRPAALPNDPNFLDGSQWGLYNDGQTVNGETGVPEADIDAPAAWNLATGEISTVVAVMDTGADLAHPDLVNEIWVNPAETVDGDDDGDPGTLIDDVNGYDFIGDGYDGSPGSISPDANPTDLSGHGTHVSGIALAEGDNGIGVTGVSQRAALMSLRICGTYDSGCPDSALIQAINYAADHGARVVNGSIADGSANQAVADALESHPGTLYVFAAGNGDSNGSGVNNDAVPNYPCNYDQGAGYTEDNVVCVAATDQDDRRADFSNYGASAVDLGAPGVNIYSTSSQTSFFSEDFEGADFATSWTNTSGPGWATTSEAPLTSVGVTDSVGVPYAPSTTNTVISNPVTLDPGYSSCELRYHRAINLGAGDEFQIAALLDTDPVPDGVADVVEGFTFTPASNNGALLRRFFALTSEFDAGGQLQVRLRLTSDASGEGQGIHMDNIEVVCFGSPSDNGYEFLDGTSMAAPMVTGTAALMFSDDPGRTASQVKSKLLDSVDVVPDLAATTVSGGRLNAYAAMVSGSSDPAGNGGGSGTPAPTPPSADTSGSVNLRPNTFFRRKPGRTVRTDDRKAKVVFRFGSDKAGSTFRCRLKGGFARCPSRMVRYLKPDRYVLKVRAIDGQGLGDTTPAVARFRVKSVGD